MFLMILQFLCLFAFSQTQSGPTLNNLPIEEQTTISIKKGQESKSDERKFEIVEGGDELEGDAAAINKEARDNWKKACADWKTEIKELNKDNQIIQLSCGSMKCATVAPETICRSSGKYKIKVKMQ